MDDYLSHIAARSELPLDAKRELDNSGFAIIPGPVTGPALKQLSNAYDAVVAEATRANDPDLRIGSTTTRLQDLVNRGIEFDPLYIYGPVLEACCHVIGGRFKLSSLLARTLRPGASTQPLHVDFKTDQDGWPMLGFILMVDDFTTNNGATRFVPGSHKWSTVPEEVMKDPSDDHEQQVLACGPAGSAIIYNGSAWHSHTPNHSGAQRRSIQGAYIPRDAEAAMNHPARIHPETSARIGSLAKFVLAI
jgi:hypothetical protein